MHKGALGPGYCFFLLCCWLTACDYFPGVKVKLIGAPVPKKSLSRYSPVCKRICIVRLAPGATAYKFDLSGGSAKYADFDGKTLSNIRLTPGNVAIFRIDPRIAYIACSARYSG